MKNFFKHNKYLQLSLYAIFVVVASILFYRISSNTDNIAPSIVAFFGSVISVLSPILYGFLIAYLINPIMDFFEGYLLLWFKPQTRRMRRLIRSLSILTVYIVLGGVIILVFRYLFPQIAKNIREIGTELPVYMDSFTKFILSVQDAVNQYFPDLSLEPLTTRLLDTINPSNLFDFSQINNLATIIMNQAVNAISSIFNYIMGIVVAFYILVQKESISYAAKRVVYCLFSKSHAERIISIFSEGHEIFIQFFVGKFIDSTIIGIIAFIGLSLMDNPYTPLLALIIGVTNMIPYFGPIIGAVPAVAITLFEGIAPAVGVLIFVFLLQQFDGLVLGPKILGDSIGLSPFWIITGILIGGALWGPLGMFFACPIIAVLLLNLNRFIDRQLINKEITVEEQDKPIPTSKKSSNFHKALNAKKKNQNKK